MQTLAKQLTNEDQEPVLEKDQVWHALQNSAGDTGLICTGEFIEYGAGHGYYVTKQVKRGGITCTRCIDTIKYYKSIKL